MCRGKAEVNKMFPILSSRQFFFALFSFFISLHIPDTRADLQDGDDGVLLYGCSKTNYISGSQYQSNLNLLLGYLVSNGTQDGFFNASVGASPDTVYGLAQCRDDLSPQLCGNCLQELRVEVIQNCSNRKGATFRRVYCLLRYEENNFFSASDNRWFWEKATWNVSDADYSHYEQQSGKLLRSLSDSAASSLTRYASGTIVYKPYINIYGMVQCTRDLSTTDCFACLQNMYKSISDCCERSGRVQLHCPSCYIRYQLSPFLQAESQSPPPPLLSNNATKENHLNGTGGGKSTNVIFIIVPIIASVVLIAICAFFISRRIQKKARKRKPEINSSADVKSDEDDIKSEESLQFDLNTIRASTSNFSGENKIGQGGFGAVYKGELHDGREIAVKRLSKDSGQGSREFKNEVVLLHKLQHRNLVGLLGYCLGEEEKLLIYEYIPNLSLDKYIFDSTKKSSLDWKKRYNIIGGIARGLLYLHEDSRLRIIHRDLKCGNILLDEAMDAKIADFGMSKLFGVDQTQGNTSKIAGTLLGSFGKKAMPRN